MKFLVISIKKNFFTIIFILFTISLLLFSENNLVAAKNGLALWSTKVLPSLFPFFVATELLCKTNFIHILGRYFNKLIKTVFNLPGECLIAIILGIISGYPVGAKVVCNLKKDKIITKNEAERLIAFTNNSGPLFILGTVGIALLNNKKIGIILLISHISSALLVGYFFKFWKREKLDIKFKNTTSDSYLVPIRFSDLGEVIGDSIKKAIYSLLSIGGFIVLFSVILSILTTSGIINIFTNILFKFGIPKNISYASITSIIELTNGLNILSSIYMDLPLTILLLISFFLGFGGFCVLLQVYSIISKENISIKPYLYGKVLHGFFSAIITFILF